MQCAVFGLHLSAVIPEICKKYMTGRGSRGKGEGMHTAFICPLVPFRVASYVLRLILLLLALLLAALVEHLFEELKLCERYARQRAYQGQNKKAHRKWWFAEDNQGARGQLGLS